MAKEIEQLESRCQQIFYRSVLSFRCLSKMIPGLGAQPHLQKMDIVQAALDPDLCLAYFGLEKGSVREVSDRIGHTCLIATGWTIGNTEAKAGSFETNFPPRDRKTGVRLSEFHIEKDEVKTFARGQDGSPDYRTRKIVTITSQKTIGLILKKAPELFPSVPFEDLVNSELAKFEKNKNEEKETVAESSKTLTFKLSSSIAKSPFLSKSPTSSKSSELSNETQPM